MNDISNINLLPLGETPSITWKTKSGEKIAVGDMDLVHLTNAYLFCERQEQAATWWIKCFEKEANRRGTSLVKRDRSWLSWLKRRVKR